MRAPMRVVVDVPSVLLLDVHNSLCGNMSGGVAVPCQHAAVGSRAVARPQVIIWAIDRVPSFHWEYLWRNQLREASRK